MQTEALERHARLSRTAQSRRFSPSAHADCWRMLVWLFGARYAALSTVFVSSPYVRAQAALANYNMREYSPPPAALSPQCPYSMQAVPPHGTMNMRGYPPPTAVHVPRSMQA